MRQTNTKSESRSEAIVVERYLGSYIIKISDDDGDDALLNLSESACEKLLQGLDEELGKREEVTMEDVRERFRTRVDEYVEKFDHDEYIGEEEKDDITSVFMDDFKEEFEKSNFTLREYYMDIDELTTEFVVDITMSMVSAFEDRSLDDPIFFGLFNDISQLYGLEPVDW